MSIQGDVYINCEVVTHYTNDTGYIQPIYVVLISIKEYYSLYLYAVSLHNSAYEENSIPLHSEATNPVITFWKGFNKTVETLL